MPPPPLSTGTFTLTGSRAKGIISATVTFAAVDSESKGPEEPSPLPELTIQTLVDEEHPEVRAPVPVCAAVHARVVQWCMHVCAAVHARVVQRCQRVCRMVHVRV
jgi:hypothetical protein